MLAKQIRFLSNKTFGYLIATRGIQQTVNVATDSQATSIEIDVPWGKVAGKLWGSTKKQPVLTLHGWMDNAGSFDMLAPLLKNSSILAIDLPGHGLSSWLPRGVPCTPDLCTETMRLIVKHFGWDKVKLLGHSMGGILSYNYARLYPDETQFVISIDSLSFIPTTYTRHSKKQAAGLDKFIEFEEKVMDNPPSYPEEVAIEKWIKATKFSSLDIPTTKVLMKRGAKRKEDGTYYYTRDFRLSIEGLSSCYTLADIKEISELITCPYLVITASQTPFAGLNNYWSNAADVLQKTSKDFQIVDLEGSHHMHMMKAELVANVINPFLDKHDV